VAARSLSQGRAPYKTLISHGFVLDEKMKKMSKSLGNGAFYFYSYFYFYFYSYVKLFFG
jgi:methionyl-tRNA synthetase